MHEDENYLSDFLETVIIFACEQQQEVTERFATRQKIYVKKTKMATCL